MPAAVNGMKQCTQCRFVKSVDNFYNKKRNKDGLTCSCKKCINKHLKSKAGRESQKKHRQSEAYKEYHKEYQKEYQKEYLQSEAYKESKKKHRQSEVYKECRKRRKRSDSYMIERLISKGIAKDQIIPELIEVQRFELKLYRKFKIFKNERK